MNLFDTKFKYEIQNCSEQAVFFASEGLFIKSYEISLKMLRLKVFFSKPNCIDFAVDDLCIRYCSVLNQKFSIEIFNRDNQLVFYCQSQFRCNIFGFCHRQVRLKADSDYNSCRCL